MLYAILLVASGLTGRRLGAGAGSGAGRHRRHAGLAGHCHRAGGRRIGHRRRHGRPAAANRGRPVGRYRSVALCLSAGQSGANRTGGHAPGHRAGQRRSYLRTIGLQKWTTGQGWSIDELTDGQLPSTSLPPAAAHRSPSRPLSYQDRVPAHLQRHRQRLTGADAGWSFDAALESVHRTDAATPAPYESTPSFAAPSAADLRADTVTAGGQLTETGDLPPRSPPRIQVTAGATTAFDKAEPCRATSPIPPTVSSTRLPSRPATAATCSWTS